MYGGQSEDRAVEDVLDALAGGPQTPAELHNALATRGIELAESRIAEILGSNPAAMHLTDEAWVHVPVVAEGMTLTHRLTGRELDMGLLDVTDLHPFAHLAWHGWPLDGGGDLELATRRTAPGLPHGWWRALAGPDGWLESYSPGDLLALALDGGRIRVGPVDETALAPLEAFIPAVAIAVRWGQWALDAYRLGPASAPGIPVAEWLLRTRVEVGSAVFADPMAPLTELLAQTTLEVRCPRGVPHIAVAGAPWTGMPAGLDDEGFAAAISWAQMAALAGLDGAPQAAGNPDEGLHAALESLARSPALTLAAMTASDYPACGRLLTDAPLQFAGATGAAAQYLAARAAEGAGDARAQEQLTRTAIDAGSGPEAVGDLAELCSVRGDAAQAWQLYERAGVGTGLPDGAMVRGFLRPGQGEVSRNQPCPCGSGKKYKMCHGRDVPQRLDHRSTWLYVKAHTFAMRPRQWQVVLDFDDIMSGAPDSYGRHRFKDLFAFDFALFDGGLLERFLRERGPLLPDDEHALGESWLLTSWSLLEVTNARAETVYCRDLVTGETFDIFDRVLPRTLTRLDLVFGRPLPSGGGEWRFFQAPRLIPRTLRGGFADLLSGGAPAEEVAWLLGGIPSSRLGVGAPALGVAGGALSRAAAPIAQARTRQWGQLAAALRSAEDQGLDALDGHTLAEVRGDESLRAECAALIDDLEWAQRHDQPIATGLDIAAARRTLGLDS